MLKPNEQALVSKGQTLTFQKAATAQGIFGIFLQLPPKTLVPFLLYILNQEKLHSVYTALVNQYVFFSSSMVITRS